MWERYRVVSNEVARWQLEIGDDDVLVTKHAMLQIAGPQRKRADKPSALFVSARQLLVGEARGPIRRIAEAAALVFFVGFEIPLEPFDMAVAFEGEDVGRQAV